MPKIKTFLILVLEVSRRATTLGNAVTICTMHRENSIFISLDQERTSRDVRELGQTKQMSFHTFSFLLERYSEHFLIKI